MLPDRLPTLLEDERQRKAERAVEPKLPPPGFRTKCFRYADHWFNRLINLEQVLHNGFWLGCLSVDDLNAVTAEHYRASQHLASAEHIQSGFFDWEARLVNIYFRKGSRVLVAAAGTGREILALRGAGFSVEGFECNPSLLSVAQRTFEKMNEPNPVIFCAPDKVPPGSQIYDALIVGWGGYTHIATKARRIGFLEALRHRALPHAPVLLSFFTRTGPSRYDTIRHRTAAVCRTLSRARKDPVERGDDLHCGRYVHRFTRDEVEEELRAAGFRMLHYEEEGATGYAVGTA